MTPPQAGDVLVFDGRGLVSGLIRLGTCSAHTHVAICAHVRRHQLSAPQGVVRNWVWGPLDMASWQDRVVMFESTTLRRDPCLFLGQPFSGVQAHDIRPLVDGYPGRVWRLLSLIHI